MSARASLYVERTARAVAEIWPEQVWGGQIVSLRLTATRCASDGQPTGQPYTVTGLQVCLRQECLDGQVTPCAKRAGHTRSDKHNWAYCHNWHEVSLHRLMHEVLATYGTRYTPDLPTCRTSAGRMSKAEVAATPGITVDEYRAQLAAAVS